MYGMYSVQILEGGAWKQMRVYDADWMGKEKALQEAIKLAKAFKEQGTRAAVEHFAAGGTTSLGCKFDTHQIKVTTLLDSKLWLNPVPFPRLPCLLPEEWLQFQGTDVPETELSEAEANSVVAFMRWHQTIALTDGTHNYTLAGNMLAYCRPELIQ